MSNCCLYLERFRPSIYQDIIITILLRIMGRKRKLENVPKNDAKVRKISEFMCASQSNSVAEDIIVEFRDEVTETKSDTLSQRPKSACSRKFRDDWTHNRPWLTYNPQTRNMYCSVCLSANVTNSFTSGCDIMKKESVTNHEKSKGKFYSDYSLSLFMQS